MVKRILVGLAGTIYTPVAVRNALDIARRHGAHVTGVTVVDEKRLNSVGPVPAGAAHYAQRIRERRLQVTRQAVAQAVAEFETACREANVPHEVRSEVGKPFELMLSLSRYHDLTVFGIRSVFEYDFGARDPAKLLAKLVKAGMRPILAVCREHRPVRRALVAYSGSMESAKTMRRFVQMRLWEGVSLRIVHFGTGEAEGRRLLADAAAYFRAYGYEPEVVWVGARPKNSLLSHAASWDADLVVLGNSARSLFRRRHFGKTALVAMREADRALFLSQ